MGGHHVEVIDQCYICAGNFNLTHPDLYKECIQMASPSDLAVQCKLKQTEST